MKNTEFILRTCHVTSRYRGYRYLVDAVDLVSNQPDVDFRITKDIYPALALKHHTTSYCIEHNIRTVVKRCWSCNRSYVETVLGYKPPQCPSNMEFINSIAYFLENTAS